jgi:agmatinase
MDEVHRRGMDTVITDAISEAMEGVDYLYVSVDIDSLDPAYAPGTGTPEPGGISSVEMLRALRRLAIETPLVAFDVMEVAPPYDHADCTVNVAHRLIMEVLAGLAWKKSR